MELDSHADTTAVGKECVVLADTGNTVTVEGFGKSIGNITDVPIVTAAAAYDDPHDGKTYLLVFNQVLYIPDLDVHLINPYQLRDQGLTVNEIPLQLLTPEQRTSQCHSIISDDPSMHLRMTLKGTTSGFTMRTPTEEE